MKKNKDVNDDLKRLFEAATAYNRASATYRWILKANHCLPKKKEKRFDRLATIALVRMKNAESRYSTVEREVGKKFRKLPQL